MLGYQIRKSGLSIPSNVAEGFARHSTASYIQHLWTAHASGAELQTQLIVGTRIDAITEPDASALITDAEDRLVTALDNIASGHFPPKPNQKSLCTMCAFVAVCRTPGGLDE